MTALPDTPQPFDADRVKAEWQTAEKLRWAREALERIAKHSDTNSFAHGTARAALDKIDHQHERADAKQQG